MSFPHSMSINSKFTPEPAAYHLMDIEEPLIETSSDSMFGSKTRSRGSLLCGFICLCIIAGSIWLGVWWSCVLCGEHLHLLGQVGANATHARCLDGSPAGYYLELGEDTTHWVIWLQGWGRFSSNSLTLFSLTLFSLSIHMLAHSLRRNFAQRRRVRVDVRLHLPCRVGAGLL